MAMIRKQVYIEQEQDDKLKHLAQQLGLTESELIRRAIEAFGGQDAGLSAPAAGEDEAPWKRVSKYLQISDRPISSGLESLPWSRSDIYRDRPRSLDEQAWIEELAFIEEIGRLAEAGDQALKWSRENAYDKRRLRLPD